jgi:hypothetical protein
MPEQPKTQPVDAEVCRNCRFFVWNSGAAYGDCHARPPTYDWQSPSKVNWPICGVDDWCGSFQKLKK